MDKKILLVDDDMAILDATAILLESEGYTITSISNPDKVFEAALEIQPQLILLDVLLSGKDGREIASNLKKNDETKEIPIILLSAYSGIEQTYEHSGADDFIAKPFEVDALLTKIEKFIK